VPILRIPEGDRETVVSLSNLAADVVAELNDRILASSADWHAIESALEGLIEDPEAALRALVALAATAHEHDLKPEWIADAIRQDLGDAAGKAPLELLLRNPKMRLFAKRKDVCYSHERVASNFRIFTEMRPIFDEDASQPIEAAVITHSLRILYVQDSQFKEFFVTLDADDLANLQRQVERASQKSENLSGMLNAAHVTIVQPME
jgi:hypothetical protein